MGEDDLAAGLLSSASLQRVLNSHPDMKKVIPSQWFGKRSLRWVVVAFLLCVSIGLQAHPHVLVDMRVTPELDSAGNLIALHQEWRFDTFYSVMLREEMHAGGEAGREKLLQDIKANLAQHGYYTRLYRDSESVHLSDAENQRMIEDGRNLEFHFTLPLSEPVTANGHELRYRIYEPTYYIEMLHAESDALNLGEMAARCESELDKPSPTSEQLQRAAEVDEDGVPEDPDLGQHFAETMTIRCHD